MRRATARGRWSPGRDQHATQPRSSCSESERSSQLTGQMPRCSRHALQRRASTHGAGARDGINRLPNPEAVAQGQSGARSSQDRCPGATVSRCTPWLRWKPHPPQRDRSSARELVRDRDGLAMMALAVPDGRAVVSSMAEAKGHCCNTYSVQHTVKMTTVMMPQNTSPRSRSARRRVGTWCRCRAAAS